MTKLIWRNLLRNKRRSVLTVLSVAFALVALGFLSAFLAALESTQGTVDTRLVVRSSLSLMVSLPESYWRRLQTLDHVQAVTPLTWVGGVYQDPGRPENSFPRFATDPESFFAVYPEIRLDAEQKKNFLGERTAFIAGRTLAAQHGWKLGDQIFLKGDLYPADLTLTLRGVFDVPGRPAQEKQMFLNRRYLEAAAGNPGTVSTYFMKIDSTANAAAVIHAAEAMFEDSANQVRAESEEAFQVAMFSMFGNIRLLFLAVGLALLTSVLFINASTVAMAARERTTEVAVLRTLGFPQGKVVSLVIGESVGLALAGAVLGCGLCWLLLGAFAPALDRILPSLGAISLSPGSWGVGLLIGLSMGALAGLVPAAQAARVQIAVGLRRAA